ncbi:hypothetical protein GQ42DRAFT_161779 [Ramicandelaber brevisporus]|nr:hypothetical protein GQ42DRAFT_161779 [Ramicandelaber brevisporus]
MLETPYRTLHPFYHVFGTCADDAAFESHIDNYLMSFATSPLSPRTSIQAGYNPLNGISIPDSPISAATVGVSASLSNGNGITGVVAHASTSNGSTNGHGHSHGNGNGNGGGGGASARNSINGNTAASNGTNGNGTKRRSTTLLRSYPSGTRYQNPETSRIVYSPTCCTFVRVYPRHGILYHFESVKYLYRGEQPPSSKRELTLVNLFVHPPSIRTVAAAANAASASGMVAGNEVLRRVSWASVATGNATGGGGGGSAMNGMLYPSTPLQSTIGSGINSITASNMTSRMSAYSGVLPYGLTRKMSENDVVRLLGIPNRLSEYYGRKVLGFDKLGMQIEFEAGGAELTALTLGSNSREGPVGGSDVGLSSGRIAIISLRKPAEPYDSLWEEFKHKIDWYADTDSQ